MGTSGTDPAGSCEGGHFGRHATRFTDLVVWQKAHALVLSIYEVTRTFPRSELYGLTSQIRRAAVSIPANIAEGFKKRSLADKMRYLNMSQGSAEECRYYLMLAKDLGYAETSQLQVDVDEIARLLAACRNAIQSKGQSSVL